MQETFLPFYFRIIISYLKMSGMSCSPLSLKAIPTKGYLTYQTRLQMYSEIVKYY